LKKHKRKNTSLTNVMVLYRLAPQRHALLGYPQLPTTATRDLNFYAAHTQLNPTRRGRDRTKPQLIRGVARPIIFLNNISFAHATKEDVNCPRITLNVEKASDAISNVDSST
jgi:hypothetical protein